MNILDIFTKVLGKKRSNVRSVTTHGHKTYPSVRIPPKEGYRPDLKMNFRSQMEANVYRYFVENHPELTLVEFEPHLFTQADGLPKGFNYLPDFRCTRHDGSEFWVEVKGVIDEKTQRVFKIMRAYRPDIELHLIGPKAYEAIKRKFKNKTLGWEGKE